MLSGNSVYLSMDSLLKEELKQARRSVDMDVTDEKLEIWKRNIAGLTSAARYDTIT